jgi:BASS family bile acid:Na+ symporter
VEMIKLLRNRNFILLMAIVMGLSLPGAASWCEPLVLPVLAFIMALATMSVPNDFFRRPRSLIVPSLGGILMSYLLQGGIMLTGAAWLIDRENLWTGFVIIAAAPPAVAVIPFSGLLNGNVPFSLAGTVASYLAALVIMPAVFLGLLGTSAVDPVKLLTIVCLLIILPLAASRILLKVGADKRLGSWRGLLTDWGFFVVLYTLIGLNRNLIFKEPLGVLPVSTILFAGTFLLGFLIEAVGAFFKVERADVVSLVLLGTMKNQGLAGGLALSLFSEEAALPAAVSSIFMILFLVWLDIRGRWRSKTAKPDARTKAAEEKG